MSESIQPKVPKFRLRGGLVVVENRPEKNPRDGFCNFWLDTKQRFCKLPILVAPYCSEHALGYSDQCTKKCSARPKPSPDYYEPNINWGQGYENDHAAPDPAVREASKTMTEEEFGVFARKVEHAYNVLLEGRDPPKQVLEYEPLNALLHPNRKWSRKHTQQIFSLLGHMNRRNLIQADSTWLELGAGRGEFSYMVLKALAEASGSFVLIDRGSFKFKDDRYFRYSTSSLQRLKADLKDVNFANMEALKSGRPIIAYSKHLCGVATDLSLRGLMAYVEALGPDHNLEGIVIACCCHQLCQYKTFVLPEFLEELRFSGAEYERLRLVTSWRVCGSKEDRDPCDAADADRDGEADGDDDNEQDDNAQVCQEHSCGVDQEDATSGAHWSGLNIKQRERLGYQAKRIIDMGRIRYLQQHGFDAELVEYADVSSTPENICIIATRRKESKE
ncbi:hypothetical protein SmJEL517_g04975 [Synchytrium microbalum]|uniref:tRNA:m(4)X modification enzyme TRM13 n=1 Tax=Synchytrium microbalum TaxID=1806994 RepID=A0A507BRL1_9FUNG|nr:uncharacterized protein SmJEL517_g04975 [Synchytrium microbalum]TPX31767.1 hypothetical protein SmJEL517_g04975 [Synchytrium microbalum]